MSYTPGAAYWGKIGYGVGYDAYKKEGSYGLPPPKNPYNIFHLGHKAWEKGYADAKLGRGRL